MDFFKKLFSKKNNDKDNIEQDFLNDAYNSLGEEHLNPERILDENSVSYKTDSENEIAEGEPVGTFGVHEREYENDRAENDENKFLKEASEHENIGFEQDNFENSGDRYDEDKSLDLKTDYEDIEDSGENSDFDEYINEDEDISEIEEFDPESAYDNLGGDTGEMDTEAISAAADMAQNLSTDELSDRRAEYGRDFIPSDNYISEEAQEETFSVSDEAGNNGSDINSLSDTRELEQTIPINSEIDKEEIYSAYAPKNMRLKVTQTSYFDLDNLDDEPEENLSDKGFRAFCKRRKKWLIGAGVAAAVVLVIVGTVFFFWNRMDPLMGYTQTYVAKGNVIKTMAAGGNVEPNARYDITSLVSGTIIETPLNAGEQVRAGELVYKIDDTNAQLAVQMAENDVKRAKVDDSDSGSSQQLRIYANASGTISDLNISAGSSITGGKIATITQANGTEFALIPNVTGTVQSVNVRNGSTVESGQVVATLKSDGSGSSKEGRELDIASCELALEQANKELEKYKIAAPIDGTILVKNAKIGDNVNANQTDKPLMVIADMSKMKFNIEVDELEIWNIELGQTVVITANALPGQTFSGEITNIAGEGEKKGDGVTTYAVEITISDPGKIKSGMNVDAKIIINSAINVLSVPERTLYESDGTNALVITNSNSAEEDAVMNPAEYPNINVPEGYKLVKVQYGVSDGTNVEIISGLSVGDTVLYKAEDGENVKPADSVNSGKDSGNKEAENSSNNSENSSKTDKSQSGDADSIDEEFTTESDNGENVKSTGKLATQEDLTDLE